jgi:hypothetical protein
VLQLPGIREPQKLKRRGYEMTMNGRAYKLHTPACLNRCAIQFLLCVPTFPYLELSVPPNDQHELQGKVALALLFFLQGQ